MPETLFISDLHLAPERPTTVELFLGFLRGRAREANALFILGDLFDAWIGDDDDQPPYPEIRSALRRLTEVGTSCRLMHGNRDFLIGRTFARDTGCTLLHDPALLELDGVRTLLMHGDLLCTDDLPYQKFRRRIRNPIARRLFLWKSLPKRRAIACDYRRKSGAAMAEKTREIMDVSQVTVEDYLRRFRADRLIHGHTHRPADHPFELGDRTVTRSVLAEWQEDRGELLVYAEDGWRRERILPS
ncbi:MAG: UDP-2,3-diacylglucosamine diphosphatase [Chromatiaceae bacterium]|nr:UDP-2,3-diacylglucosamine diphosphatase [Chromatiaceae bacterium]